MSKTPVELKIDGFEPREVMMATYSFNKSTDSEGQLTGIPRGGKIKIRVKAMNNGNPELMHWMLQPEMPKDGCLIFLNTKDGTKMKEIEFKDAYCVDYTEYWEDRTVDDGYGHWEEIVITFREIKNGPVAYSYGWA